MMQTNNRKWKIAYCLPALYMAGGMERVLTLKANYFAEEFGYDVTIILTEGKDKPAFYPLSPKVKVVNLDIGFEELWNCSFVKKVFLYLKKQRQYKKRLTAELMAQRPDITISLLRREINFINDIKDGSRKFGEIHINRAHFRTFEEHETNAVKSLFSKFWMYNLLGKLRRLDRFVVLTEIDKEAWSELDNVEVISDPLPFVPSTVSPLAEKRVLAIARYSHEKGIDLLLKAWAEVEKKSMDWRLDIYGDGDRTSYEEQMTQLHIDHSRCQLHERTNDVEHEYCSSSVFVLSSRFEGFGMVIIEAMACGLPVVSFDCPWGPRSIIMDGEDGLLAENGNVSALAERLLKVINDDSLRHQMSVAAANNVQRFRIENIAHRWKALFDSPRKNV